MHSSQCRLDQLDFIHAARLFFIFLNSNFVKDVSDTTLTEDSNSVVVSEMLCLRIINLQCLKK